MNSTTAADPKAYASFAAFYPFYLGEHSNRTCRRLHFLGSTLALVCLGLLLWTGQPQYLLYGLLCGYGFAGGCSARFAPCAFESKTGGFGRQHRAACAGSTRKRFGGQRTRFGSNPKGRGLAGDPRRCKTRQAVQACLGFCALRLIPPNRAARDANRAKHPMATSASRRTSRPASSARSTASWVTG